MRILLLVDCYVPSTVSSAKHMHDLANQLARLGHEPLVAAPDETLDRSSRVDEESGVRVLRVRTPPLKGSGKVARAINEWRLPQRIWREGRELFRDHPCDLIVFYSPTIFFGPLVARLRRLWSCPSYLILRDIFPAWAVDAGILRADSLAVRYFRRKELQQYAAADVIGVQSPANLKYFEERGWAGRYRLEVLYNWATLNEEGLSPTDYRTRWGLEDKIVFFFGGNLGVARDLAGLVRLARAFRDDGAVYFQLVGDGAERQMLESLILENKLDNISIRPPVGQWDYLGMLHEFDVGLISLDRSLKTQNFPGKMFGYLYASMPILASVNPGNDLKTILEEHDAGLVFINGEDDKLLEGARRLARDGELRERLGRNGRALLERRFSVARAAQRILAHASGER